MVRVLGTWTFELSSFFTEKDIVENLRTTAQSASSKTFATTWDHLAGVWILTGTGPIDPEVEARLKFTLDQWAAAHLVPNRIATRKFAIEFTR